MAKVKILGTLKGVTLQSKLDNNDRPVHTVAIKVELSEGHDRVQEITENLKEMIQLEVEPRQPKLH